MDERTRLLVHDALVGLAPLAVGGYPLYADGRFGPSVVLPLVVGALAVVGARYADEHGLVPEHLRTRATDPLPVVVGGLLAVVLVTAPIVRQESVVIAELFAFVGAGLGFAGYRVVFGGLRPVPDGVLARSEAADESTHPPSNDAATDR